MKIEVIRQWDAPTQTAEGDAQAVLTWNGEYRKGDIIVFSGLTKGSYYVVKVDASIESSFILAQTESITYTIPFYEKKESYNPLSFAGIRHYLSIREARSDEINAYRNLALNPFDQHDVEGVFPHASANVETRGESVFAARNAIDGVLATTMHGDWPYESWGINRQDDAVIRIDFGREVWIDAIHLYTRADFPHDNWWTQGTFTFSDGTVKTVSMDRHVQKPHVFDGLNLHGINWLTLGNLIKADDPSPFPALTQIEVYGANEN